MPNEQKETKKILSSKKFTDSSPYLRHRSASILIENLLYLQELNLNTFQKCAFQLLPTQLALGLELG